MGTCPSREAEEARLREVQARMGPVMERRRKEHSAMVKLLLLGTGESGKSTVFKQMIKLHGRGFSEEDRTYYKTSMVNNIVESMQVLVQQSKEMAGEGRDTVMSPEAADASQFLQESPRQNLDALADVVETLWADPGIQATYALRSQFQLPDNAATFMERARTVLDPNYVVSDQDVFCVRVRTTGMAQETFNMGEMVMKVVDVGGQRNERKKWIHCFEEVTAVIFVVGLSEYDQVCYEDGVTPRLDESLHLFGEMVNSEYFERASFILFLNKHDLFQEKLRSIPLSNYLSKYKGSNNPDEATAYIEQLFVSQRHSDRDIFIHTTTATDSENMRKVIDAIKHTLLREGLESMGFL